MDRVARELERIIGEGPIPSASIAVRVAGSLVLHHTVGLARLDPPRPARRDEPYDLASLTKPIVALVAAGLVESGTLSATEPVVRILPDVDPRITVAHLLNHTSGYPAWAPLYQSRGDRVARLAAARRVPLAAAPGTVHTYSDLGYLVLLQVLETVGAARIDTLLASWLDRAGLDDLRWGWPGAAATEDSPLRGRVLEGEVHDPNAFVLDGVSSHAGLFGTARAVAAFGDAVLDAVSGRRSDLPGRGIEMLWGLPTIGSHQGGWDRITENSNTGSFWPTDARGHVGYTGTSLWVAPRQRVVVALLTNRVHPHDGDKAPIRAARRCVYDAVAGALGWDRGRP